MNGDFGIWWESSPGSGVFDTLEVPSDGIGLWLKGIGSTSRFLLKADSELSNSEPVVVPAAPDCHIRTGSGEFGNSVECGVGEITDEGVVFDLTMVSNDQYQARLAQWVADDPANNDESNFVCRTGLTLVPKLNDIESADLVGPALSGSLVVVAASNGEQVTISGLSATDRSGISKWQWMVEGGSWVDIESPTESLPETLLENTPLGIHVFHVRAVDGAGNPSESRSGVDDTPLITGTLQYSTDPFGRITMHGLSAFSWVGVSRWMYKVEDGDWVDIVTSDTILPPITLVGIEPGVFHDVTFRVVDTFSNESADFVTQIKVSLPDTEGPVIFDGISENAHLSVETTATTATLTMEFSTDGTEAKWQYQAADPILGFDILNWVDCMEPIVSLGSFPGQTITELDPETSYLFGLRCLDAVGNSSVVLEALATTLPAADTVPPSVVANSLNAVALSSSKMLLYGASAYDLFGIDHWRYKVLKGALEYTFVEEDTIPDSASDKMPAFVVDGLDPGTYHYLYVCCSDPAGNESSWLADVGTTLAPGQIGVAVIDVTHKGASVYFDDDPTKTYKVAITQSDVPPADWSAYPDVSVSPYVKSSGLYALETYYAHVRSFDGSTYVIGTSLPFTTLDVPMYAL